jgi:hypothetical protein
MISYVDQLNSMSLQCRVCQALNIHSSQKFTKKATISPRNIEVAEKLFKKRLDLGKCCNMHYEPLLNALKEFRAQETKEEEKKESKKEETKEEAKEESKVSKVISNEDTKMETKMEETKMESTVNVENSEKKERNLKRKREEQIIYGNKKMEMEIETLRKMVEKTEKETKERLDYMERIFRVQIEAQQQQIKYLQQQIFELSDK